MHLHILGICGTFMGGLAAIAKAAGHRVTGCDANVYPPMSDQLAALGIELTEGYDAAQLDGAASGADVFVVGNVVTRGNPLIEAILDAGLPYTSGPQWLCENVLAGKWMLAVAGTHGKTTTASMLAWILEHARLQSGIPDRRRAARFRRLGAAHRQRVLRDRGRRVRHGVLRQALEVRPLPAAHGDTQQSRIRPRRHLRRTSRRSRRSSTTSCARCRASGRLVVNGEEASLARVLARGCWSEVERFGDAQSAAEAGAPEREWRIDGEGRVIHGTSPQGILRWPDAAPQLGRAQPAQCARGARGGAARRRPDARGARGVGRVPRHQAPAGNARHRLRRHRLRRLRAPSDGDRDDDRRTASRGRRRAHHRRAGAAIEHDEAGRDEGRAAGKPRRRGPRASATRPISDGTSRAALAPLGAKAVGARRPRGARRRDRGARRAPAITCS